MKGVMGKYYTELTQPEPGKKEAQSYQAATDVYLVHGDCEFHHR